jgi:hypothetical protein
MKILIIGSGRCGSSQLQLALHKEWHLPWCSEPFNTDLNPSEISYQEGRVTLSQIRKPDGEGIVKICAPPSRRIKGCVEFAHEFDLVICLDRRNEGARILSALHAIKYNTWYGKYKPQKLTLRMHESGVINDIVNQKTALHEVAKTLGARVIYLEDLYEKFRDDEELSKLAKYFDPKARYCEI